MLSAWDLQQHEHCMPIDDELTTEPPCWPGAGTQPGTAGIGLLAQLATLALLSQRGTAGTTGS